MLGLPDRGALRAWDAESGREDTLKVARGNEIAILGVLADEAGDIGTERNNTKMIDSGEVEGGVCEFGGEAFPFKRRRHFRVGKDNAVGEAAIGDEGTQAVNARFEALSFFVVGDGDAAEIQIHLLPRGFGDFFIPKIA